MCLYLDTNVVAPGSGSGDDDSLLSLDDGEESDTVNMDQNIEPNSTSTHDNIIPVIMPTKSITHESALPSSSSGILVSNQPTPKQVDATESDSTSSNNGSNGLTLYLVLGVMCVIIALVIALVAIILIVSVMLFFVRKRKKGNSYSITEHGGQSNSSMTGNQVYNEHTNTFQSSTFRHHNNRPLINPP